MVVGVISAPIRALVSKARESRMTLLLKQREGEEQLESQAIFLFLYIFPARITEEMDTY